MRAALDLDAWRGDFIGGRIFHDGHRWRDAATGDGVSLRGWAIDVATARRWTEAHDDGLDAWVLAGSGAWIGVRVDVADANRRPASPPVALTMGGGAHVVRVSWLAAARLLRRAGVAPIGASVVSMLGMASADWWGPIAIGARRAQLDAAARRALHAFERQGGTATLLLDGEDDGVCLDRAPGWPGTPHARLGLAARGRQREGCPMTETELLDILERMDREGDPSRAVTALCHDLCRRLEAVGVGIGTPDGGPLTQAGTSSPPPARWLRSLAHGVGDVELTTGQVRWAARPVADAAGVCGVLWAAWPHDVAPRPGHAALLGSCARLAAARLASCQAGRSVEPGMRDAPALVGDSPLMRGVEQQLQRAARSPFPVLILGESGVGKEVAARRVHAIGPRRQRRFVAVNAAAWPDDLIEAELFGHARGAFTGAVADRPGVFEEADGGTLFLDEIGDLSARAQAKLLRVLQEGEVRRIGEVGARRVDVRVIAATNVLLGEAVRAGRFRADLFYRLAVICVRLPPLRERRDDIPALAAHLWTGAARRMGSEARLHPALVERLQQHDWPGNVRELQNVLAALAIDAPRRGVVLPASLDALGVLATSGPVSVTAGAWRPGGPVRDLVPQAVGRSAPSSVVEHEAAVPLDDARRAFDQALVRDALSRAGGRRAVAARQLGVSRQGLSKLVRRLGLDRMDGRPP